MRIAIIGAGKCQRRNPYVGPMTYTDKFQVWVA